MKEAIAAGIAGAFVLGSIFGASLYHVAHDKAFKAFAYAQNEARAARNDVVSAAQGVVGRIKG